MCALILGDNQYGFERALALLKQEGFVIEAYQTWCRDRENIPLIHIGDNGDYYWGTELRDQKSWEFLAYLYDEMLIGNHEAYVLFNMPLGGGSMPNYICKDMIQKNYDSGKLKFATSHDGFLITHAGVHPNFEDQLPDDPVEAAKRLNHFGRENINQPIFQSIGYSRGGYDNCGGILWRDVIEPISDKWPQIFGHSRLKKATKFNDKHWGIDVGYPDNGRIAGIYTDSEKVVEVNINA